MGFNSGFKGLIMLFDELFECKCALYYCHWVLTQLQLTNISNIKYYQVTFVSESLFVLPKLINNLPKTLLFMSQMGHQSTWLSSCLLLNI